MAIIINIKDNPNHKITQVLDDVVYEFVFRYNQKFDFWTFDILDESGVIIIAGIKIVANFRLLFSYKIEKLPKGDIIAQTSDKKARIGRKSFSTNVAQLIYLPENELKTV
jgi:hypothetical protein